MARGQVEAAKQFLAQVLAHGGLKEVKGSLMLRSDERAFLSESCELYETRSVRRSTAAGVRVAKGVWIGGASGESHQAWRKIDDGTVTITNERLVFDGSHTNRSIKLEKLLSVNPGADYVEISIEGRQKSLVLTVRNGLIFATVAHLCRGTKDPERISEKVDIAYSLEGV